MTIYLSNRDGDGKTSEEGHYKFQTAVFTGNVLGQDSLKVKQTSPLSRGVIVSPGQYRIQTNNDYSYTGWNTNNKNVPVGTADPANPRITSIVAYVDKSAPTSPATPNNPGITKLMAVNGVPAAVPSPPSVASIQSQVGSNNPYILLANIRVAAGAAQITDSDISDMRTRVVIAEDLISASSIKDNTISTQKLADLSVTSEKLDNGSIAASKIADAGVPDTKWRNGIVFYAKRVATRSIAATSFTKLACESIIVNSGGGYSNTSDIGRFTAPVKGLYTFGASLNVSGSTNSIISFYVNGSANQSRTNWINGSAAGSVNGTRALHLNAGDYVEAYGYSSLAINIASGVGNSGHITDFWGYLITRT